MRSLIIVRATDKRRFRFVWRKDVAPCRLRQYADRFARLSEGAARARARREVAS